MEKTREEILELTEEIFFIFMEHLSESDAKKFIEDDPDNILSLEAILNKKYNLIVADSGEKGIEILNKKTPHLLLLDINLPKMNGIDVLKRVKEIEHCNFPIIALTLNLVFLSKSFQLTLIF